MTFSSRFFGSFLVALAAACSGTNAGGDLNAIHSSSSGGTNSADGVSLFDAPSGTATPDVVFGVWAGAFELDGTKFDTRLEITASSFTVAEKCTTDGKTSGVVSVSAAARNTEDDMTILESKTDSFDDGTVKCATATSPGETKRCTGSIAGPGSNCFLLEGTSLSVYGSDASIGSLELVKLSD